MKLNMRLTKLEESYFSLSAHLEGERVLRKVEDDKCRQLCDFLAKQIIEIKEKQPNESFKEVFLSLKEEFINIIDRKIDSIILENKKQLELQYINNIEKINKNKTSDILDNKKIDTEFNQYRFELNNLNKRLETIDKTYDTKIKDMSKLLENLHNNNNNYIVEKSDLLSKINDLNVGLNKLENKQKNEFNRIKNNVKDELDTINNNVESRINNIHIKNINNEQKNYYDLNDIDNNLTLLKSDFDSLSSNYLKEINELKKMLNRQNNLKNQEISNFEQHFIEEYENFTKFITDIVNQNVDKIKSMNDYMNSDIEIIKNKNEYLEETLLKMREDVFDSLEKNVKYVLDKIHSYLDMQSGNISSSNNNNIENNQNKEINVNED